MPLDPLQDLAQFLGPPPQRQEAAPQVAAAAPPTQNAEQPPPFISGMVPGVNMLMDTPAPNLPPTGSIAVNPLEDLAQVANDSLKPENAGQNIWQFMVDMANDEASPKSDSVRKKHREYAKKRFEGAFPGYEFSDEKMDKMVGLASRGATIVDPVAAGFVDIPEDDKATKKLYDLAFEVTKPFAEDTSKAGFVERLGKKALKDDARIRAPKVVLEFWKGASPDERKRFLSVLQGVALTTVPPEKEGGYRQHFWDSFWKTFENAGATASDFTSPEDAAAAKAYGKQVQDIVRGASAYRPDGMLDRSLTSTADMLPPMLISQALLPRSPMSQSALSEAAGGIRGAKEIKDAATAAERAAEIAKVTGTSAAAADDVSAMIAAAGASKAGLLARGADAVARIQPAMAHWAAQYYPDKKQQYIDAGMSEPSAKLAAMASSYVQSAIEMILPDGGLQGPQLRNVTQGVMKRIQEVMFEQAKNWAKEDIEEGLQSLADTGADELANRLYGTKIDTSQPIDKMIDQLAQAAIPILISQAPGSLKVTAEQTLTGMQEDAARRNQKAYDDLLRTLPPDLRKRLKEGDPKAAMEVPSNVRDALQGVETTLDKDGKWQTRELSEKEAVQLRRELADQRGGMAEQQRQFESARERGTLPKSPEQLAEEDMAAAESLGVPTAKDTSTVNPSKTLPKTQSEKDAAVDEALGLAPEKKPTEPVQEAVKAENTDTMSEPEQQPAEEELSKSDYANELESVFGKPEDKPKPKKRLDDKRTVAVPTTTEKSEVSIGEKNSQEEPEPEPPPVEPIVTPQDDLKSRARKEVKDWKRRENRKGGKLADTTMVGLQSAVNDAIKLLGMKASSDLSPDGIRKAYRKASLAAHQDNGGTAEDMAAINAAYELLNNAPATIEIAKQKWAEKKAGKRKLGEPKPAPVTDTMSETASEPPAASVTSAEEKPATESGKSEKAAETKPTASEGRIVIPSRLTPEDADAAIFSLERASKSKKEEFRQFLKDSDLPSTATTKKELLQEAKDFVKRLQVTSTQTEVPKSARDATTSEPAEKAAEAKTQKPEKKPWEMTEEEFVRESIAGRTNEFLGKDTGRTVADMQKELKEAEAEFDTRFKPYWHSVLVQTGKRKGETKKNSKRDSDVESESSKLHDRIGKLKADIATQEKYDRRVEQLPNRYRFWQEHARQKEAEQKPELAPDTAKIVAEKEAKTIGRKDREKRVSQSGYDALPEKSRTKFDAAWESTDAVDMKALLDPANKSLRAEFERRANVKLPRTIKGTNEVVDGVYAGRKPAEQQKPLNRNQMTSVATMLAKNTLEPTLERLKDNQQAVAFAKEIDRHYKKRDGFVPKQVTKIINDRAQQPTPAKQEKTVGKKTEPNDAEAISKSGYGFLPGLPSGRWVEKNKQGYAGKDVRAIDVSRATGIPVERLDKLASDSQANFESNMASKKEIPKPQKPRRTIAKKQEPQKPAKSVPAEFSEQKSKPAGVKRLVRAVAGDRQLMIEQSKYGGNYWSIKEHGHYTGEVKGKTAKKTEDVVLADNINDLRKAKDVAQRILDGVFDKDADARFTTEDKTNIGMANAALGKMLKDAPVNRESSFKKLLSDDNWVTDGRLLMKVNDKDKKAILSKAGKYLEDAKKPDIKGLVEDGKKAFSHSAYAMEPVAYRGGDIEPRSVVLKSKDGEFVEMDKSFHDTVMKKYPNATPYWTAKDGAVAYQDNGELVALAMPFSKKEIDANMKALMEGKSTDTVSETASKALDKSEPKKSAFKKKAEAEKKAAKEAFEKAGQDVVDAFTKDTLKAIGEGPRNTKAETLAKVNSLAKLAKAAVDYGVASFADYVAYVVDKIGEPNTREYGKHLRAIWEVLKERPGYEYIDDPTSVDEVLKDKKTDFVADEEGNVQDERPDDEKKRRRQTQEPEPPKQPPKEQPAERGPRQDMTGIKVEALEAQAAALGMAPPNPGESISAIDMVNEAVARHTQESDKEIQKRAAEFIANPNKPITLEEAADFAASTRYHYTEANAAEDEYNDLMAAGDTAAADTAKGRMNTHKADLERVGEAVRIAGRRQFAYMGHIYQLMVDKDGAVHIVRMLRTANNGRTTQADRDFAEQYESDMKHAKRAQEKRGKEIDEMASKQQANDKKAELEDEIRSEQPRKKSKNRIVTEDAKNAAKERINKRLRERMQGKTFSTDIPGIAADIKDVMIVATYVAESWGRSLAEFSKAMVSELGAWVEPHLDELYRRARADIAVERQKELRVRFENAEDIESQGRGVAEMAKEILAETRKENGDFISRDELLSRLHEELKRFKPEITERETRDLFSGYGNRSELSKDDLDVKYRDYRGEARELGKIDDMNQKQAPKATGMEMHEPSDEERALRKKVNDLKKVGEAEGWYHTGDQTAKLRGTLDAQKKRLENEIRDIDAQIASGVKTVRNKKESLTDEELEFLRQVRDERKKVYEEVFGTADLTEEQRAEKYEKHLERQIKKIREQLESGKVFPAKKTLMPTSPKITALQAELEAAQAEKALMRKMLDPEFEANQQLAAAEKRAQRDIEKLEAERERGWKMREKGEEPPVSEALKKARERLSELRKERLEALEDEYALKAAIAQTKRNAAKIADRIARGDFEKQKRKPPRVWDDPVWQKAKDEELRLRRELAERIAQREWENTDKFGKTMYGLRLARDVHKAWLVSFDLSFLGIQAGVATMVHPILSAKSAPATLKAMRNETERERIDAERMAHPDYEKYKKWGLVQSEHGKQGNQTTAEFFPTDAAVDKIPGVAISERAFNTFMNELRFRMMQDYERACSGPEGRISDDDGKALATLVNVFTFTWNPKTNASRQILRGLGMVLWAPSMYVARVQFAMGYPMFQRKMSWRARRIAATQYAKAISAIALTTQLLRLIAGGDDDDEDLTMADPDWYKVKFGDTRLDFTAGLGQMAVLVARAADQITKAWSGDPLFKGERQRSIRELKNAFLEYKYQPLWQAIFDLADRKDVVGRPVTPASELVENITPLSVQSYLEAIEEHGLVKGSALGTLGITGRNVAIYDSDGPKSEETFLATVKRVIERATGNKPSGMKEDNFKKYLKNNVSWDSDIEKAEKYLNDAQLEQAYDRRDEKRRKLIYDATAKEPDRKKHKSDDTYQQSMEERERVLGEFAKLAKGLSQRDAEVMLLDYFKAESKKPIISYYDLPPSYSQKLAALRKLYREME